MAVYLYKYDKITYEFIEKFEADSDPEATKKAGKFIPLIPVNCTLTAPRNFNEGFMARWNGKDWDILRDYRKTHYKVDNDLNVYEIKELGEIKGFILVLKELGERIILHKNYFKIIDNEIVEKTEEEKKQEEIKAKEEQFNELFFHTCLGYVKRVVTFKNGQTANFLTDIVPLLEIDTPIITYNKPDFESEEIPSQNRDVKVTEAFLIECKMQLLTDFWGSEIK